MFVPIRNHRYVVRCTKRSNKRRGLCCTIVDTDDTCWVPKSRLTKAEWRDVRAGDLLWAFLYFTKEFAGSWCRAYQARVVPNQHCH